MVKSYANIKRLAPRLDEPEFQDDRNRMDESMANVASWIKDVRYFMLLQILLIGVSVYNLMYEDFVHPVICFIAVMAHIYLWKSNADSRRKLAATVGLNMAMTNLLIASDLYKMFNEDERIKDIKVQILDKEK